VPGSKERERSDRTGGPSPYRLDRVSSVSVSAMTRVDVEKKHVGDWARRAPGAGYAAERTDPSVARVTAVAAATESPMWTAAQVPTQAHP